MYTLQLIYQRQANPAFSAYLLFIKVYMHNFEIDLCIINIFNFLSSITRSHGSTIAFDLDNIHLYIWDLTDRTCITWCLVRNAGLNYDVPYELFKKYFYYTQKWNLCNHAFWERKKCNAIYSRKNVIAT